MLSVFYGDMEDVIYNPVRFFKNSYGDDWITDDLSGVLHSRMVKPVRE